MTRDDSPTFFTIYPRHEHLPKPPSVFDEAVAALKSFITQQGHYVEVEDESKAILILIVHQLPSVFIETSKLRFYHIGLGGPAKKVLVFNGAPSLLGKNQYDSALSSDWLFIINFPFKSLVTNNLNNFTPWLRWQFPNEKRVPAVSLEPRNMKQLLSRFLAPGMKDGLDVFLDELIGKSEAEPYNKYSWQTIKESSSSPALFFYALSLICAPSMINHHKTEKMLGSGFQGAGKPRQFNILYRANKFLEACCDLQASLAGPLYPFNGSEENGNILFIDDNPEDYVATLQDLHEYGFFGDHQIWFWRVKAGNTLFRYLENYNSTRFQSFQACHAPLVNCLKTGRARSLVWGHPSEVGADQIHIGRFQFLVVDLLYQWNSENIFMGPGVIKGFTRGLGDLLRTHHSHRVPEIIALSRTGDPEAIQEALRCGARGYVLKPNILKLPAVLARVQEQSRQPHNYLQSNYKKLYHLPKEVIGLLKSTIIPPEPNPYTVTDISKQRAIKKADHILKSIPKAELHCHVGTCMSQEFLIVASLVGLVQKSEPGDAIHYALEIFHRNLDPNRHGVPKPVLLLEEHGGPIPSDIWDEAPTHEFRCSGALWFSELAHIARQIIITLLTSLEARIDGGDPGGTYQRNYNAFRSLLHESQGLEDFLDRGQIKQRVRKYAHDMKLAFWWIRYAIKPVAGETHGRDLKSDDLVRLYLLVLAARIPPKSRGCTLKWKDTDILAWFREGGEISRSVWAEIHHFFYDPEGKGYSCTAFRNNGWQMPLGELSVPLTASLPKMTPAETRDFQSNPIGFSIASGTRASSLKEYLSGCEFMGSTHLKHPFLIHLYAQDLIGALQEQGHLYMELRGSPDGYTNESIGFQFPDACQCLIEAFSYAQTRTLKQFRLDLKSDKDPAKWKPPEPQLTRKAWLPGLLFKNFRNGCLPKLGDLPLKISLILVGKRHKSLRQMILEAAAGGLFYYAHGTSRFLSPGSFLDEMGRCRVVGFDLAGPEADFPPGLFAREFSRLQKLHIPMTVHAGENAPHQFVEDAILELGAQRIGHALSMDGNDQLIAKACEERICVELCPVSNHQTCHFTPEGKPGRTYPLKKFLERGVPICLNTDNPAISGTTLVREFFMASAAWGKEDEGLTFWNALRLIKMGFRHAFLPMAQRRALLEISDQIIFDYFSQDSVHNMLRELFHLQTGKEPQALTTQM